MEVVFFVNLLLDLTIDTQTHYVWISFACDSIWVRVNQSQRLLERSHALPCRLLFLLDVVLKVARKGFDLLDLLRQIRAEAAQLVDDIRLDVASFVRLHHSLLVEVAHDAVGIIEASVDKEGSRRIGVVDDVGDLEEALRAMLVRRGYLAEVGNEVLEELAPGCGVSVRIELYALEKHTLEALGQHFCGRALGRHRRVEDAVLAIVAALLVVNGHAANAAGMHALAAPAALQAAGPFH
jgi:hypothetical protein